MTQDDYQIHNFVASPTSSTVHFTSPKDWWTDLWMSLWLSLMFFEKLAIEKCLCCHCCCFVCVMAAPGERGYTDFSKFHRIIDESINLDEPISDIDVLVNSVTNADIN